MSNVQQSGTPKLGGASLTSLSLMASSQPKAAQAGGWPLPTLLNLVAGAPRLASLYALELGPACELVVHSSESLQGFGERWMVRRLTTVASLQE